MIFSTRCSSFLLALVAMATLTACEEFGTPTDETPLPTSVAVVDGHEVTQAVATDVDVAVRVLDASGQPLEGVPVAWAVSEGGGSVADSEVVTDAAGVSRTTWTLGTTAGAQAVTATVAGLPSATLTATATAGEVRQVDIVGTDPAFNAFGDTAALSARATDEFGNQYDQVSFTWASLDPSVVTADAGGEVVSVGNGEARVTATLNGVSDTLTVTVAQTLGAIEVQLEADTAAIGQEIDVTLLPQDPNGFEITDSARLNTIPDPDMTVSDTSKAEPLNAWEALVGRGLGEVTITASVGEISGSATIFFTPAPEHAVASGLNTTCALDIHGQAWCWGASFNGQLGNGTTEASSTPVQVSGGHQFVQIAGNLTGFCGVAEAGTVHCWGWNGVGGVGIGAIDEENYATPQQVAITGTSFSSIDGDWYHFCAATTEGAAYCWGYNRSGGVGADPSGPDQCPGFGGVSCAASPHLVSEQHNFTEVAVGYYHSCAVDGSGDVWCWGTNDRGQFGNGATSNVAQTSPVATVTGQGFQSIDANWSHTCAIDEAGEAFCWGYNRGGRLGDGTTTDRLSPVLVSGGHAWSDISASNGYTCGTTTADGAFCWGVNGGGKLGTGDWMSYETPTSVAGAHGFSGITTGFNTVCALDINGDPYCWGREDFGALGNGVFPTDDAPVMVNGGHSFSAITARAAHSCGIDGSGAAWCWGGNWNGQLGNGSSDPQAEPVAVSGGQSFVEITNANAHTCALTSAGEASCWGGNWAGQLGDGTTTSRSTPVTVSGGHTFSDISAGRAHTCALDTAGAAHCWGENDRGQLGDGSTTGSSSPVAVGGGHTFIEIGAGQHHSCGLTDGGEIYCWGWDAVGMLGSTAVADNDISTTPVLVDGGHSWAALGMGNGTHACGVTTANEAYCWGTNNSGRIGDGTTNTAETPVQVAGGHSWSSISAMGDHTCGTTTGNVTYCWGDNRGGDLGLGFAGDPVLTPQQVSGSRGFVSLSGSYGHTCGITASNEPFCWGYHAWGQLGNGEMAYENTPQAVLADFSTPVSAAAAIMAATANDFVGNLFGTRSGGKLIPQSDVGDGAPGSQVEPVEPVEKR